MAARLSGLQVKSKIVISLVQVLGALGPVFAIPCATLGDWLRAGRQLACGRRVTHPSATYTVLAGTRPPTRS